MKYIDAEKLKAEIKRQKHELELSIQSQGDYGQSCHIVAYDNIISIITSLQEEQPATATGRVFTNPAPKNIIVENDQWDKLLSQFDNGQRVRIILVKEDAE